MVLAVMATPSTGDTSSCCGRNGGRDRPTRSYPTKHCYWVGTPGPADASGRIARVAINLANWHNVPLADWLEAKTGLPTVLANDANCAGLAEAWLGAGRQFRNLILTLGTGVGGAIILDRKLFIGHQGTAGELSLITLNRMVLGVIAAIKAPLYVCLSSSNSSPHGFGTSLLALPKQETQMLDIWQTYGIEI